MAAVALAILAPVVFWGCLETGARLAGVTPLSEDEAYVRYTAERHCQFGWRVAASACAPKNFEHGNRRLLVTLGGSSVFGYPKGNPSFAPMLGHLLKRAAPKTWRVVNRGFACKNSHFVQDCAQRALEAGAEVLVIYAGHNDYATYGVWNPERAIRLERYAWLYDVEVWLARSRAFSALIGLMRSEAAPQRYPAQPDPEQVAAAQMIVRDAFTRNIGSVIDAAARHGARIILVTVVSNLYEYPVKREEWDSSPLFDPGERPDLVHWARDYKKGIAQHRAGEPAAALAAFASARDSFMRGRAPALHNERVRELAARHPHVALVDVERLLHARAAEGIGCNFFGNETYCDQFHPNERTHRMIAAAVLDKLRELGLAPARRRR
jgi:lysophospholipase L1-like esterase